MASKLPAVHLYPISGSVFTIDTFAHHNSPVSPPYPISSALSSLANSQPVVGLLALYTLALKASCYDLNTLTFTVNQRSETLLTRLKRQMALEKEHITCKPPHSSAWPLPSFLMLYILYLFSVAVTIELFYLICICVRLSLLQSVTVLWQITTSTL